MSMRVEGHQYRLEYTQRRGGYSGVPEHWARQEHTFNTLGKAEAHLAGLHAYIEQMAERYPGEWIRDIGRIMRRDVAYSEWEELGT